jgi:diguanylate cyclase (GGDEF)-like protein
MSDSFDHFEVVLPRHRLRRIIAWACALTLTTMGLGSVFALNKNWEIRLSSSHVQLIRGAEMVNMLIDHALVDASKALSTTKHDMEKAMLMGEVSPKQAYVILMQSMRGITEYNRSEWLGTILWVDARGQLVAESGEYKTQQVDFSDHFFFQDLVQHPENRQTIGPLLRAHSNGQWVFRMAVPVYDGKGEFAGVLVQQLLETKIVKQLEKYINPQDFLQILTHYNGSPVSFAYPAPTHSLESLTHIPAEWMTRLSDSDVSKGTDVWDTPKTGHASTTLVGFARSTVFGLVTFATLPMDDLIGFFFWENINIFIFVLVGILVIVAIFYQVHKLSLELTSAQDKALHDPLTTLHNRRALDEALPVLLRNAMRSQQPLSVLFVDIDFFRHFNEDHGHETGDLALQAVAQSLASCCRRPFDLICRWGGEEFVAVLPDTNAAAAEKVAIDMLQAVRSICMPLPRGGESAITVSVGCVTSTVTPLNHLDDLVDMADKAMQEAKQTGRDKHVVFQVGSNNPFIWPIHDRF